MARHKVEICGVNTANIKVLNNEEMLDLFKRFHNGDMLAREELVNGNLKLVLSILKKYTNRTDNMDDLFQIGCVGLMKAIDNFDLSHEVKFSTYAVPMILGEVRRYLRDNNSIRVSRSLRDLAYKSLQTKEELTNKLGLVPTHQQIAEVLGVSELDVTIALDSMREPVSIFEPIYNDGGDTIYLYEQLEDKRNESKDLDIKMALAKAIDDLSLREQQILDERFIIGKTQMEIASELGISQAQVSRLEKSAINTLKKVLK
jgi:RNA polymerase sporulation-specific sigma factor